MGDLVVLLRTPQDPDPYEEVLVAEGFEVASVPVLAFDFVNGAALRQALEHPSNYGGIILTSPRAVNALADAMSWLPTENALWHAKPIFAVGPRTASEVRSIGFEPEGEESGSAAELAEHIRTRTFSRPLLFVCGNRRQDVLPARMKEAGIRLEELVVYETKARSNIELANMRSAAWLVFFSPSGLEAIDEADSLTLEGFRIAAIGPTTAAALREDGLQVHAVADEPSPRALALAIRSAGSG